MHSATLLVWLVFGSKMLNLCYFYLLLCSQLLQFLKENFFLFTFFVSNNTKNPFMFGEAQFLTFLTSRI